MRITSGERLGSASAGAGGIEPGAHPDAPISMSQPAALTGRGFGSAAMASGSRRERITGRATTTIFGKPSPLERDVRPANGTKALLERQTPSMGRTNGRGVPSFLSLRSAQLE